MNDSNLPSKNRSLDHRLRNKVGGFLLEPDTADGGDTLAIALCSYFEKHMHRPKDDPESENGWGQWAEEKTSAALDALTRALSGDSPSAPSEIDRLREELFNARLELARTAQEALRTIGSVVETNAPQAPIAKVTVRDDGPADVVLYAPGLPPGQHDLFCEPESVAPYPRATPSADRWIPNETLTLTVAEVRALGTVLMYLKDDYGDNHPAACFAMLLAAYRRLTPPPAPKDVPRSIVIGYQKETHSESPTNHEWREIGEGRYRSICARWTESKENLVPATEITCQWCLNRQRRRAESNIERLLEDTRPSPEETERELTLKDFGYAPGNYTCKCLDCDQEFVGDKRASRCETCAAQALRENRSGAQKTTPPPCVWRTVCKDAKRCAEAGCCCGLQSTASGPKPDAEKAPVTSTEMCHTWDQVQHKEHNGKCVYCGAPMSSQSNTSCYPSDELSPTSGPDLSEKALVCPDWGDYHNFIDNVCSCGAEKASEQECRSAGPSGNAAGTGPVDPGAEARSSRREVTAQKASAERCRSGHLYEGRLVQCWKDENHSGRHYNLTVDYHWGSENGKADSGKP